MGRCRGPCWPQYSCCCSHWFYLQRSALPTKDSADSTSKAVECGTARPLWRGVCPVPPRLPPQRNSYPPGLTQVAGRNAAGGA